MKPNFILGAFFSGWPIFNEVSGVHIDELLGHHHIRINHRMDVVPVLTSNTHVGMEIYYDSKV